MNHRVVASIGCVARDRGRVEIVGHLDADTLDLAAGCLDILWTQGWVELWPALAQLALILVQQWPGANEPPILGACQRHQSAQPLVASVCVPYQRLGGRSMNLAAGETGVFA